MSHRKEEEGTWEDSGRLRDQYTRRRRRRN
jgi:hypothetical protein